jgi:hypothetical protein
VLEDEASSIFAHPIATHVNGSPRPLIVQYVIRDLDDRELNRANDARSAWEAIEARWPDAMVSSIAGPPVRGWMKLSMLMEEGDAVVLRHGKAVGGVVIDVDGGPA